MPAHNLTYRIALVLVMSHAAAGALAETELSTCTRTTHVSHGGQDQHQDLGDGRVMWREWWSQEGTSTDYVIVDCEPGAGLRFRTAEENIGARAPFDRTEAALAVIATHERGSRIFATLQRMADDLRGTARDITLYDVML
ncbi:MAG: hypothetical protein AAF678_10910, partial [Pseudomonadota bacterium]